MTSSILCRSKKQATRKKRMRGKKTNEYDISFPASDVWQVYSTLELPELIKTMPDFLKDIKVTGDGPVGTTFDLYNFPGNAFDWYKERIGVLDHQDMIKEVDVIAGGYLDLGYTFFRTRFEILEKGPNLCTVKSIVMYEIKDEFAANEKLATIDDMETVARAVEEYLKKKKGGGSTPPSTNLVGLPG